VGEAGANPALTRNRNQSNGSRNAHPGVLNHYPVADYGEKLINLSRTRAIFTTAVAALVIAAISAATVPAAYASPQHFSNTDDFLRAKFVNGQFVAGFTPGVPDYGFSLEALIQRKALGETSTQLAPAVDYLLAKAPTVLGTDSKPGYLVSEGNLKLGLTGKWLFTSVAVGAKNGTLRRQVIAGALSKIDGSGDLAPDAHANTYDRAWLVLGLAANGYTRQSADLAGRITLTQLTDGGFNDGFTAGVSSADGTGISLQALAAAAPLAGKRLQSKILASEIRAVAYLKKTQITNHFESFAAPDVNGTAYAAMGLVAVGKASANLTTWLSQQLTSDGGFATPWSQGAGDIYATAQAVVAAQGKSYLNLLKGKK